jgi:hypothetical protein
MGADVDLNEFFETLWSYTAVRVLAVVAVVIAVLAVLPGRKRR